MALIKVTRKEPEVKGGATTALVSEESLEQVLQNGWVVAETEKPKGESKAETKTDKPDEQVEKVEAPKKAKKSL